MLGAQVVVRVNLQILLQHLACVLILRLRRKIETDPRQPALLRTERGVGYYLAATAEVNHTVTTRAVKRVMAAELSAGA